MYERAELLGGRLAIQSAAANGTRVTLDLPISTRAR
jgi:signal transduction histidine kinase